jgi:hypothetical protein
MASAASHLVYPVWPTPACAPIGGYTARRFFLDSGAILAGHGCRSGPARGRFDIASDTGMDLSTLLTL